jgi:hypothetical protein
MLLKNSQNSFVVYDLIKMNMFKALKMTIPLDVPVRLRVL